MAGGMAVTRMWGQYPKVAFVLHVSILVFFTVFLVNELLTRKDRYIEVVLGLAALATASTLILNTRGAMRNGWRSRDDIAVDDDDGDEKLEAPDDMGGSS
jgi:hypothetical protein